GSRMFAEVPKKQLVKTFVSESFLKEKANRELLGKLPYETVTDAVFAAMADTQTPQGILAKVRQMEWTLAEILERGKKQQGARLLLLETIQDPGNLGTILRTAEGAGITGVIMNEETVDIYSPKVTRSTMGAIYRLPFVYVKDWKESLLELKRQGIRLYAAHLAAKHSYDEEDYRKNGFGFLIGNEGNGLTEETAALADCYIKIPMEGEVESLNAAVAASILMFEAARQRRHITKSL
ncbi:MAG: RNA methyltransferase, partial [bacterium]|nr:RNA methyltransferase [bacterium]